MSTSNLIKFVQQLVEHGYSVTFAPSPGIYPSCNLYLCKPIAPDYKLAQVSRTTSFLTLQTVEDYESYLIYELGSMRAELERMEKIHTDTGRSQRRAGLEIVEAFFNLDDEEE